MVMNAGRSEGMKKAAVPAVILSLILAGCGVDILGSSKPSDKLAGYTLDDFDDYTKWAQMGHDSGTLDENVGDGIVFDYYHSTVSMAGYDSGKIVIGDSRCVQLGLYEQASGFGDFATFAVWGGHYAGGTSAPILTEKAYADIEQCFTKQVDDAGSCEIYLFATVNDYDYAGGSNTGYIDALVSAARRLSSMEHGGVSPHITVIGFEGCWETGDIYGTPHEQFNAYIDDYYDELMAKMTDAGFYKVRRVSGIIGGKAGFIGDGLHYDEDTIRALVGYIMDDK